MRILLRISAPKLSAPAGAPTGTCEGEGARRFASQGLCGFTVQELKQAVEAVELRVERELVPVTLAKARRVGCEWEAAHGYGTDMGGMGGSYGLSGWSAR